MTHRITATIKPGKVQEEIADMLGHLGKDVARWRFDPGGVLVIDLNTEATDTEALLEKLRKLPGVYNADRDVWRTAF